MARLCFAIICLIPSSPAIGAVIKLKSELKDWKWHESTILAAVSTPAKDRGQNLVIARSKGWTNEGLIARLWTATKGKSRGLYIVIPGTGSDALSGTSNLLADRITNQGFDAVVVANPFSTAFQRTFSADGLIGFPQKDIDDTVLMMNAAYNAYVRKKGEPRQVRIIGYSLGATYVGMLSQRKLNFNVGQYVLLNPPVRFGYAMDKLDAILRDARNDDRFTLLTLMDDVIPLFRLARTGVTRDILPLIRVRLRRPEYENTHVIGASFGFDLGSITYGLKKTKAFSSSEQRVRMNLRFYGMTFERYLGLVGIAIQDHPSMDRRTFQSLIDEIDLKRILKPGKNLGKMVIVTNVDDFLIEKRDIAIINSLPVRSFYLFDGGGHSGNYWTDSYTKLIQILAK